MFIADWINAAISHFYLINDIIYFFSYEEQLFCHGIYE